MDATEILHKMRLEGAYGRAQHFARWLTVAAQAADGSAEATVERKELEAKLADAVEAVVWMESLHTDRPSGSPSFTDLTGKKRPEWSREI